jgi:hypothetical protein
MQEHCHLHFIVTGGGLTPDGQWKEANKGFFIPTRVLAAKFRGKFLAYLRKGFENATDNGKGQGLRPPDGMSVQQCLNLLNKLGRKKWHCDIEPAYEHANGVFKYVGRYIRRGPISEKRIASYDGETLTIAYAHPENHKEKFYHLKAETFVKRILSHVPEKGTHMVRSYGLFHPNCIDKLNTARFLLGQEPYEPITDLPHAQELLIRMFPEWDSIRCPECGSLLRTVYVDRRGPPPPSEMDFLHSPHRQAA